MASKLINFLNSQSYKKDFKDFMGEMESKYGSEIMEECGIGSQLDIASMSKHFFGTKVTADVSVDANANVTDTSVISHKVEMAKPFQLINSYYRIYKELKKSRGVEYARKIVESQINGRIYINDFHAASSGMCYCFNYSTYDTALMGIPGQFDGRGGSKAPKSLMSFLGQIELFALIAGNSTLGATGLADLLIVMSIYAQKLLKTGKDAHFEFAKDETFEDNCWQYIESMLTGFIYRLNQPYRGSQSLFSNVSVFDDNFLEGLLSSYTLEIDGEVYTAEKEVVKKMQEVYIDIMNRELARKPLTFPVTTACFSIDEEHNIQDREFLKFIAQKNLKFGFINIYSGKSSTLSSCCFTSDTVVNYNLGNNDINKSCTLKELYDEYKGENVFIAQNNSFAKATPIRVKKGNKKIICFTISEEDKNYIKCTDDHRLITKSGVKLAKDITLNDSLLMKDGGYITIENIKEVPYKEDYVYCVQMEDQKNDFFTLANDVTVKNCRLRSEQDNEYFNSFGSGSTKIGSLGVSTGNLPQLAQKVKSLDNAKEVFLEKLKELVIDCQEVNHAKRNLIKKAIKANAQPLYSLGYMDIKRQYSTFGVVGLFEALKILGMDIRNDEGKEFALKMLNVINSTNKEIQDKYKAPHNCEQIPAENVAVKLAKKDRILGLNFEYELYSNQFIPLIERTNILDRIELQGLFDKHFSGGAICHLNMDQEIKDVETMSNLIETCANKGVVYFAINYVLQECEDGHLSVGNVDTCPICGKPIKAKYTRVVGFLTKVNNWNKVRREQDFPNRQFYHSIQG